MTFTASTIQTNVRCYEHNTYKNKAAKNNKSTQRVQTLHANSAKAIALSPCGDWIYLVQMQYLIRPQQHRPLVN